MTTSFRVGTLTESLSFNAPELHSVTGVLSRNGSSTTGNVPWAGTTVTVFGGGFGPYKSTPGARLGFTALEASSWSSETMLLCRGGRTDRFQPRNLMVTGGERLGTLSDAVTLDLADVQSLSTLTASNSAGTGSTSLTVHGINLGMMTFTHAAHQQTGCEGTEWESETALRCLVSASTFGTRRVTVTGGQQIGSVSEATTIDKASI